MLYKVTWEIEIDAETPEEAAKTAAKIQRDPESIATIFKVEDDFGFKQAIDTMKREEE
jgi:hypothetical protein